MSQCAHILNYLESGKQITAIDALLELGCFRLAARIKDLRDSGKNIHTEIIKSGGKRFARYSLL